MRIVKMSEEEKKKWEEEYEKRNAERIAQKKEETARINREFERNYEEKLKAEQNFVGDIAQKGAWIGKKTGIGALSGTVGIGQAGITELANNFDKGNKKSVNKLLNDVSNSIALNPINDTSKVWGNILNKIDPNKKWWENLGTIGTNIASNAFNSLPIKRQFNALSQITGKILPSNTSDKVMKLNNSISNPIEKLNQKLDEEGKDYDKFTQTLGNTGQVVGNMVPSIAVTVATKNPTVGLGIMGMSAKGQSTQEALNKGATLNEAIKIGDTKATIELGTEMLTGGVNIFGKGALDEIVEKGINKKVKNEVLNYLAKKGTDVGGEIVEEAISDVLGTVVDRGTVDPNATYSINDFKDTAVITMLSTLALNAIGGGYTKKSYNENIESMKDYNAQQKLQEAQEIINNVQNNPNNVPVQEINQEQNKITQNENVNPILQLPVENNQQTLYNNNESESGVNGQVQQRGVLESNREQTRIYENNKPQAKEYTRAEYEEWERSIKPIEETNITIEQRTIRDNIKRQYNKDIVFFDGSNNAYSGGVSYSDANRINIDIRQADTFGLNKMIYHEVLESDILNNKEIKKEIIEPILKKIVEDPNFEKQKNIFWEGQEDNMPNDYLIAKDILCDRFSEIKTAEKWDYDNVLSQETNMTIDFAIDNFEKELENNSSFNLQPTTNIEPINETEESVQKQRKHYKSISESEQVSKETRKIAKDLYKKETYVPISNLSTMTQVNENISKNGIENTYISFTNKLNTNEKVTLQDIATGERLIQIYSEKGDMNKVRDLVQSVSILGTELGQQVQALSLIKKASPEGQLMYLEKVIERTNTKENTNIKVTDEMREKILKAKNQEELENVLTDVSVELGEQLPLSNSDKVRSWRYLSMLGNPKTHIKNIGANIFMNITQQIKNKTAGGIEDIVGLYKKDLERTKTLKVANEEQRIFAKQDAEYMKDKIDGGGKYDVKNLIQNNKKQFNNKVLDKVAKFNSDMLELEDNVFLKLAYKQALQNYMSANKLSSSDMKDNNVLQRARQYASYQAQEATFHQFNELARRLTEIENKGGVSGSAVSAVLPFKKTPMNIAKSGIEYSPIGLAKSLTYDIVKLNNERNNYKSKLENGNITQIEYNAGISESVNKVIDNMAKGLTGTSIAVLGYTLANMGMLKAGNDDKEDEFREKRGEQEYSIMIGDSTYTLDWVSPSAIPLFVGATVNKLMHSQEDTTDVLNSFMTASAKAFEPMTEMSMLQGITSAISSYEQGSSNMIFDIATSATSSYLGQFVPTAMGQVAKIIDPMERDTSSTKSGVMKKVEQFTNQQMAKIPIVSKNLPVRKDVWGNDKTRSANIIARAYNVAIAPYNKKKLVEDATDKELLKLFDNTGENVLPNNLGKELTIDRQKYRLSSEEYNNAKELFGKTSKQLIDGVISNSKYKSLSDAKKVNLINNVFSYAKEQVKINYAKENNISYESSKMSETVNKLQKENVSKYFLYLTNSQELEKSKEKIKLLLDSNITDKDMKIIYEKNIKSKKDDEYKIIDKCNMNITEYLKYKTQEFESDKKDDGTINGKTISSSKQKKIVNYMNSMNITGEQRLLLYAMNGYKTTSSQKDILVKYVNKLNLDDKDVKELYSKFSGFKIYKNGTVKY